MCVHGSGAILIRTGGVCKGGLKHWGNLQWGNIQYTEWRCDVKMWCEVNYKVYTIFCLLLSCYAEGCRPSWIWVSWASLFSHAPFSVQLLWGVVRGLVLCRMVGFSHGSPVVGWLGVLCHWLAALCAWSAFILQCQQWLLFCILNVVRHSSDRPMACQHLNDWALWDFMDK